jgi:hypothetical protein
MDGWLEFLCQAIFHDAYVSSNIFGSLFNHVIWSAQQLEKDLNGSASESIASEKKLGIFDKIFSAYHDARSCIRNDLVWKLLFYWSYFAQSS